MPRMRPHTRRLLATAAMIGVGAGSSAPAIAEAAERVDPFSNVTRIVGWADQGERAKPDSRKAAARKRALREAAEGPFVPVVGKVDYGTAGNEFGAARSGHIHAGHDMFAPAGRPLIAVDDTIVLETGSDGGQGNYIHLYDPSRERTYIYMHMVAPAEVEQGDRVEAGERLGGVGCTGSCWGDHLHFEVRAGKGFGAEAQDPLPLLGEWKSLERPR